MLPRREFEAVKNIDESRKRKAALLKMPAVPYGGTQGSGFRVVSGPGSMGQIDWPLLERGRDRWSSGHTQ
jgi:hypothetical protein